MSSACACNEIYDFQLAVGDDKTDIKSLINIPSISSDALNRICFLLGLHPDVIKYTGAFELDFSL